MWPCLSLSCMHVCVCVCVCAWVHLNAENHLLKPAVTLTVPTIRADKDSQVSTYKLSRPKQHPFSYAHSGLVISLHKQHAHFLAAYVPQQHRVDWTWRQVPLLVWHSCVYVCVCLSVCRILHWMLPCWFYVATHLHQTQSSQLSTNTSVARTSKQQRTAARYRH